MADEWDDSIKRLFREHPQDYVSWLVNGAIYQGTVSGELKNRTRHTDQLLSVMKAQKEGLLHIEVQSKDDKDIENRLLEYNLLATLTYHQPVITCLILLRPVANAPKSPLIKAAFDEFECWRFQFIVVKLWEIPALELVHTGLIGLLPLVPLANGGTEQEALTTVVSELYAAGEYILLSLTKLIAGLKMRQPAQQEMLERMFAMYQDALEDSWVYQEILRRGVEQGMNQGLEKGLSQGLEKGLNQGLEKGLSQGLSNGEQRALLAIIQKRYPEIWQTATRLVSRVTDTALLENVIAELSVTQTVQEAMKVLNELDQR